MTDNELRQGHERMKELQTALTKRERPPELEQVREFVSLTQALMAELRARGLTKELDEAQASAPEGTEVGFNLDATLTRLLHQ